MSASRKTAQSKRPAISLLAATVVAGVISIGAFATLWSHLSEQRRVAKRVEMKSRLRGIFEKVDTFQEFPTEAELSTDIGRTAAKIQYTFDLRLQEEMEDLFRQYRPDYGAFVALDATTGRVLSMVSYSTDAHLATNLALRATFPAASVFKVITAAAAIGEKKFTADSQFQFNGRNHTLYRSHVLKDRVTRWTRTITLRDAFAHSVNTVFGRIGLYNVGPEDLRSYASRFAFNRPISADLPVQEGRAWIPDNDPWGLAEAASGFTRENRMSPLQGALIAAAVVNGGVMMEPFVVERLLDKADDVELYRAEPTRLSQAVDPATAQEIRSMMRQTVSRGTSRKSFRGFGRQISSRARMMIEVGGKTGSLTGDDPKGKYDWFVGYGERGDRRIAIAALTVHRKYWRVKSAYLARRAMEQVLK